MKKGIVLHDCFAIRGGGEQVALALAKGLGFDLAYGFWGKNTFNPSVLNSISKTYDLGSEVVYPGILSLKLAWRFRHKTKFLDDYESVIYSGNYAPMAIHNHPHGRNIFYCHTPVRFMYDKRRFYLKNSSFIVKVGILSLIASLQASYEKAVKKMDIIIANSANVQQRIKKFIKLDSQVIHPGIKIPTNTKVLRGKYYLSLGRLDPLKRIDMIAKAFLEMPEKRVIIASGGPEMEKLKRLTKDYPNIEILGWIDEQKKRELLQNCIALIYIPKDEDFGITPLEAMAMGKPVIGVKEGGLLETIQPGVTGYLLEPQFSIEELREAVYKLTTEQALNMAGECFLHAKNFSQEAFIEKIKETIPL